MRGNIGNQDGYARHESFKKSIGEPLAFGRLDKDARMIDQAGKTLPGNLAEKKDVLRAVYGTAKLGLVVERVRFASDKCKLESGLKVCRELEVRGDRILNALVRHQAGNAEDIGVR